MRRSSFWNGKSFLSPNELTLQSNRWNWFQFLAGKHLPLSPEFQFFFFFFSFLLHKEKMSHELCSSIILCRQILFLYIIIQLFNLFESGNWATSSSALCFSFLNLKKKHQDLQKKLECLLANWCRVVWRSRFPGLLQSAPVYRNFSLLFSCIY